MTNPFLRILRSKNVTVTQPQTSIDRLPPQNVEAEEAILGGILLDPEALNRVSNLAPEMFSLPSHQIIFKACQRLAASQKPTDLLTVRSFLADKGVLEKAGGYTKLVQLVESTVSAVNIDQYAELVEDKYRRRLLIQAGNEIAQMGYETSSDLSSVLDRAEEKMFSVTQSREKVGLTGITDALVSCFTGLEERSQGLSIPGLPCNFYDLDAITGGFQRSDFIILAGRPSMGKTAFALNTAHAIAAIHRLPVAIFSLEMSKEQLVQRLLASEAGIPSDRIRSGRISPQEWESLSDAVGRLAELPLHIDDSPCPSVNEIRSQARRLQAENGGKLGFILIDYLQLMGGDDSNRVQELSRITRSLKGLARELNVPVIALSQLSRGVELRGDKRPMMSDLRDSGSLEQDADLVLMLYREEYYIPDTPDRGIAEIIVAKHRNGPTGTVKMLFDGQHTRFLNMATRG